MANPLSRGRSNSAITDLDMDTLTRCGSYLSIRDISNMAMSCKYLNRAAYSDSIWLSFYRQEWPLAALPSPGLELSIREAYLSRHVALHQFKFMDPLFCDIPTVGKPSHHILLDRNIIIFAQGSSVHTLHIDDPFNGSASVTTRGHHNARITCTRLFSLNEMGLHQYKSERDDDIVVTSSCDHLIRLWSKINYWVMVRGKCLLVEAKMEQFAFGLPTPLGSEAALKTTFYGHDKPVSLMSVAGHRTSLLVSISKNGKVLVWDTTVASSSVRSSFCVGMTRVPVSPVDMKCHESLLYVAAGSSVVAVDLRTMQRAFSVVQQAKIQSFGVLPSKSIFCTGGTDRAMLWDVRKVSNTPKAGPALELIGHVGPVKLLHMDLHKVVTGGPEDPHIKVSELNTGVQTNFLTCFDPNTLPSYSGCSAMAVDGCGAIASSGDNQDTSFLRFWDFKTATCPVPSDHPEEIATASKFWGSHSDIDSEG